jgi:hypothetical protein
MGVDVTRDSADGPRGTAKASFCRTRRALRLIAASHERARILRFAQDWARAVRYGLLCAQDSLPDFTWNTGNSNRERFRGDLSNFLSTRRPDVGILWLRTLGTPAG